MPRTRALVTVVVGARFEAIWSATRPTFEAYAERLGLDLVVIREAPEGSTPQYAKRGIHGLLDRYERLAFLDADILIRDDAPDLFELVPEEQVGMFEEGRFFDSRVTVKRCFLEKLGSDDVDWVRTRKYYNSGVMVVSRRHAAAFACLHPEIHKYFGEQTHLNYLFWKFDYKVFELDHRLNRMPFIGPVTGEPRQHAFLIHYAGLPWRQIVELMMSDRERWRDRPVRYPRHVCLELGGPAGHQIACEPLVRYCFEHLLAKERFVISTAYPEVFSHYDGRIEVRRASEAIPETDCHVMRTAPAPSCVVAGKGMRQVPSALWHPLDYGSLMTIQRQLVGEERRVTLPATPFIPGMERSVIVDCGGAGAAFPQRFWDTAVQEIVAAGLQPFVIGREATDTDAAERARSGSQLLELLALCRCVPGIMTADPTVAQVAGTTSARVGAMLSCRASLLMPWQADYEDMSPADVGGSANAHTPPTRTRVQRLVRSLVPLSRSHGLRTH